TSRCLLRGASTSPIPPMWVSTSGGIVTSANSAKGRPQRRTARKLSSSKWSTGSCNRTSFLRGALKRDETTPGQSPLRRQPKLHSFKKSPLHAPTITTLNETSPEYVGGHWRDCSAPKKDKRNAPPRALVSSARLTPSQNQRGAP